jgi:hypothetical protein
VRRHPGSSTQIRQANQNEGQPGLGIFFKIPENVQLFQNPKAELPPAGIDSQARQAMARINIQNIELINLSLNAAAFQLDITRCFCR